MVKPFDAYLPQISELKTVKKRCKTLFSAVTMRQLEKSGVNVSLKRYPPIWTCVDAEDLQRLINRDE